MQSYTLLARLPSYSARGSHNQTMLTNIDGIYMFRSDKFANQSALNIIHTFMSSHSKRWKALEAQMQFIYIR